MTYEQYSSRRLAVSGALAERGCDAVLVTAPVNVRYLTGFTGSNGAVLLTRDSVSLATDGRYDEQAQRETGLTPTITRALLRTLVTDARTSGARSLAIERDHVTLAHFEAIADAAEGELTLTPCAGLVENERMRKDETELGCLRRAAAIADAAFTAVKQTVSPGMTERELADALEEAMRRGGADAPAFATIVAAGVNGAEPHHQPTSYALALGDLVTVDMGARVDGYHSDMTRTFAVGPVDDWQRELYGLVDAAQRAGCAAVVAGAGTAEVDAAARAVIENAGHGEHFVHGVGHGVGLQIHESPMLFGASEVVLADGMVVTVEPGIYVPGRGGIRIEDTLIVSADAPEVITRAARGL
ncbi:MAG: hypothetical protein QOG52_1966 [Frankiaceae bacterium]|nr:hypothetical protein [Frankiaceae bacterium]